MPLMKESSLSLHKTNESPPHWSSRYYLNITTTLISRTSMSINKYSGCFLGLAIGDALGAPFEGGFLERLLWGSIGKTKDGKHRYTDDTQMSIDVANSLIVNKSINQQHLATTFANSYRWSRGYGPSAAGLLKKIKRGARWESVNRASFNRFNNCIELPEGMAPS